MYACKWRHILRQCLNLRLYCHIHSPPVCKPHFNNTSGALNPLVPARFALLGGLHSHIISSANGYISQVARTLYLSRGIPHGPRGGLTSCVLLFEPSVTRLQQRDWKYLFCHEDIVLTAQYEDTCQGTLSFQISMVGTT